MPTDVGNLVNEKRADLLSQRRKRLGGQYLEVSRPGDAIEQAHDRRTAAGRVKCTVSRVVSRSTTVTGPSCARAAMTASTSRGGAEAPAGNPTTPTPSSHSGRMSLGSSMR